MPNLKNAKKALKQSKKREIKNFAVKENIKWLRKKSAKAIENKTENTQDLLKKTTKAIDKAIKKGLMKKNTGNRNKSRMMKKYNVAMGVGKKNK